MRSRQALVTSSSATSQHEALDLIVSPTCANGPSCSLPLLATSCRIHHHASRTDWDHHSVGPSRCNTHADNFATELFSQHTSASLRQALDPLHTILGLAARQIQTLREHHHREKAMSKTCRVPGWRGEGGACHHKQRHSDQNKHRNPTLTRPQEHRRRTKPRNCQHPDKKRAKTVLQRRTTH